MTPYQRIHAVADSLSNQKAAEFRLWLDAELLKLRGSPGGLAIIGRKAQAVLADEAEKLFSA